MKILFALDPWIYRDSVGNQLYTLENIFIKSIKGLMGQNHDVRLLLGEDMRYALENKKINIGCKIVVVPLNKLYSIYANHYEAHKTQFFKKETNIQKEKIKKLIKKHLNRWEPEIIISFTTPASVWSYIYKNALSLQFENGIFSRAPYPYLCQLDPFGFLKESYPSHFMEELRNENITKKQKSRIDNLIELYKKEIFKKKSPIKRKDIEHKKNEKIFLVPLSYNGVIINDAASQFRSQLDYLLFILEKLPKNIKVLVTRHSLQLNGSIPPETELFLEEKYPNLSFCGNLNKYAFLSQWLTPLVDGIITINSTIGYHGALFKKKVITLGDCEINSVATYDNIDNPKEIFEEEKGDKSLNVLYHLLTRHSFLLDKFWDGEWLTDRLKKLLVEHKKGNLKKNWKSLPLVDQNEEKIFQELIKHTPGLKKDYSPRLYTSEEKK